MSNNPLVSIVIPTYNRKKLAERLIRSLIKSTYKNIEIIVIDDASPDNTKEYLEKIFKSNKKIKIHKNKKNMFAAGSKNEGQKRAKGIYMAFIDDDNVVDKNMIKEMVEILNNNPEAGEVGPINYNYNKKSSILLTRSTRNMWTSKTLHMRTLKEFKFKDIWEADDVPNAFMVRKSVIDKNKIKFKPKYGIMYEESDYAYQIRKAGYKVYMVKKAKIYHDIEDSGSKKKSKDYLYHFMEDPRRPYVFARNRLIFHSLYSNLVQQIVIFIFWIWFFTIYYCYKLFFYSGFGEFTLKERFKASLSYLKGTLVGYAYVISGTKI